MEIKNERGILGSISVVYVTVREEDRYYRELLEKFDRYYTKPMFHQKIPRKVIF